MQASAIGSKKHSRLLNWYTYWYRKCMKKFRGCSIPDPALRASILPADLVQVTPY